MRRDTSQTAPACILSLDYHLYYTWSCPFALWCRSRSRCVSFLSDAVILNHSHPLTVSATHFLICIRVLWNEIHHGKNKADGRDTAGSQSIHCPLVPVIISHSVTGPGCRQRCYLSTFYVYVQSVVPLFSSPHWPQLYLLAFSSPLL